jgi:predicted Rossmann-fold nucleotide-binding protein
LSRNHINVLTSDAVLVLPGGSGTLSEVELAAEYGWTPVLLFLGGQRVGGFTAAELKAQITPDARIVETETDLGDELRRALAL